MTHIETYKLLPLFINDQDEKIKSAKKITRRCQNRIFARNINPTFLLRKCFHTCVAIIHQHNEVEFWHFIIN